MISDDIRPVSGCGPEGCGQYVMRGEDEFGKVVDSVAIDGGEVWEIDWDNGTKYLHFRRTNAVDHQIDHQDPGGPP